MSLRKSPQLTPALLAGSKETVGYPASAGPATRAGGTRQDWKGPSLCAYGGGPQ